MGRAFGTLVSVFVIIIAFVWGIAYLIGGGISLLSNLGSPKQQTAPTQIVKTNDNPSSADAINAAKKEAEQNNVVYYTHDALDAKESGTTSFKTEMNGQTGDDGVHLGHDGRLEFQSIIVPFTGTYYVTLFGGGIII